MSAPLVALLLTTWLGGTVGLVLLAFWLGGVVEASWPVVAIPVLAALFVALFGTVVLIDIHAGDDGVVSHTHSWQGGSGPNTVCNYQTRTVEEMVGLTPTPRQVKFTVCADAS